MNIGIFFDIDGTLRDMETARVPESAGRALRRLRRAGYFLGIATGRAINEIEDEISGLVDWDAFVCLNGQAVYTEKDGLILEKTISIDIVERCLAQAEKCGRPAQVMMEDGCTFLTAPADEGVREVYRLFGLEPPEAGTYRGEKLTALMIFGHKGYDYADYQAIGGLTIYPGTGPYADVVPEGASKHAGIVTVMEHCGLDEYIAFGDSLNDTEMLLGAKLSVAMGNAIPEVQKLAGHRTASVVEDGIERACEALGLYNKDNII